MILIYTFIIFLLKCIFSQLKKNEHSIEREGNYVDANEADFRDYYNTL